MYWKDGEGTHGYNDVYHAPVNRDAVMRTFQRSALMEVDAQAAVNDVGEQVQCDDEGKRILRKQGTRETWRARRYAVGLHRQHAFTHAAFTDASKRGNEVGYGVWEGVHHDVGVTRRTTSRMITPARPTRAHAQCFFARCFT